MSRALIINIQKFSIHDGEGIRTVVFFKGCPLSCQWCHNPESHSFAPQIMYQQEKCSLCMACVSACPARRLYFNPALGKIAEKDIPCPACGACAEACLQEARQAAGRLMTVEEIMAEIDQDAMFYEQSGGGVTLSGGEVMAGDMDFVVELLRRCRQRGYSVYIDTSGYAPYKNFERVLEYVDVFLYDIKLMDDARHRQYTGHSNRLILDNLVKLSKAGANIYIRMPLIAGVNCSDADIQAVLRFLQPLNIRRVYLLPYHDFGRHKAERLGRESAPMAPPAPRRLEEIKAMFEQSGYIAKIGG
ncbi:MAG: glycyl-radical enzyme activating protein [Firmicutes bacterium]|nr:glycyl-radical enzyme activating protein [Bacillota bacterium]